METHSFTITSSTGECFPCRADESILSAMRRANAGPIRCGCFGGGCGACKMRIVSGSFIRMKPMSRAHVSLQDEQSGIVLLCCVYPQSNLTLADA